jgi:type II secretory pathway component PulJ
VRIQQRRVRRATSGFSYVEILLSVTLLAILLAPAMEALQAAIASRPTAAAMPGSLALQSKMEQVLAAPFARIYGETYQAGGNTTSSVSALFSDTVGAAERRLVVIYRYDASAQALSDADTGLAYVSVYYEAEGPSRALATLAGRWW